MKPTQMILEKAQQRSIIANGARQWWIVRFPWRIKDVQGWHIDDEKKKKNSLGEGEQVVLVHSPQGGLETYKEAETHT